MLSLCASELSSDLEDDSDSGDEGGSDEAASDQEETGWKHQVEQVAEHSAPMLNKQELLRQHHLKEHIDKLEGELQRKQDILKGLRFVVRTTSHSEKNIFPSLP